MSRSAPARWRGWAINAALLLLLYLAVQAWQGRDAPSGPAPPFSATTLDGRAVTLEAYRGRPVLLYFWATWCNVCALTRDAVDAIALDHPVLTIASQSGSDAKVAAYVAEHDFRAPVVNDRSNEITRRYGVRAYPTFFILDGEGHIREVEVGLTSEWGLRLRLWLAR